MVGSASNIDEEAREIQALAKRFQLPEFKVVEVYRREFERLASQSRIDIFLDVLALRNTKSILRGTGTLSTHRSA